jgi:ABC-type transporter Mla MlaB component
MEPIKISADHSTLKITVRGEWHFLKRVSPLFLKGFSRKGVFHKKSFKVNLLSLFDPPPGSAIPVRGRFDMSLVFDLWQTCQLEQDRYHTYIFDLGRVGELRDSGLAWLMMFHRRAARAGAGVRLINCRPEITERCVSAGLEIGSAVPIFFVHVAAAHTVYLAREPIRGCVHKTRLKELMDHYNTHAPLSKSELEALDVFLISGATPNACMNMEELDGFFAALICGPEMVMPSEYLPIVWGQENEEDGLVFESEAQAQQIFSLLTRHWNTIATTLDAGETYEPLLYE